MDNRRNKSEPATQSPWLTPRLLSLLATVLFVVILAMDLLLPLGVAAGVPYVAVVLLGWWFPKRRHVFILAGICTALTIAVLYLSPEGGIEWMVYVNRFLALFAIWVSAALLIAAKTATENLRNSEERNRLILDSAGEGIYGLDKEGRTTFANSATTRLIGWEAEELIGKSQHDILHHTKPDGSPYPRKECPIYAAFKDGKIHRIDNEVFWRKDGSCFPVEYTSTPIRKDGELVGAVVTFSDITERKHLQKQLRQSQRMEAIGQLTGGIAHDFNNLLAVMIGNTEILEDRIGDDEKAKHHIEELTKAVGRASSLTDRLLAFSRQQTLTPTPTDISGLVDGLDDMLRRTLGETIDLRTEPSDFWPAMIDPSQLENALVNLAVNARDAMPKGGTLTIETANITLDETYAEQHEEVTPGDYVMIAVSDTGNGMSPEVLEKVFEPFFTTKGMGEGSGLGLSMVYGFVKQSNGHITIYSEVGHGTTIKIYLPRSKEAVPQEDTKYATPEDIRGSECILVVEDDDGVREVPVNILRNRGYEVVEAGDGKEAIKHLKHGQSFDLLFTDLVLPGGMNGVEIAEVAKHLQPNMKVLYTTGYAENAVVHNGKLGPGVPLVNKPYRRAELLEKVRAVLDGEKG